MVKTIAIVLLATLALLLAFAATRPDTFRVELGRVGIQPFEAYDQVEFTLQPEGAEATRVTWAMQGPVPYLAKIAHLVFNMDRMVGQDFEDGLANLQAVAQKPAT